MSKPLLTPKQEDALRSIEEGLKGICRDQREHSAIVERAIKVLAEIKERQASKGRVVTPLPPFSDWVKASEARARQDKPGHAPQRIEHRNGSAEGVSGGLRRMMIALWQRPNITKQQIGVRAGLSSSSGTFGTYLAKLRSNGWIEENSGLFCLSENGAQALGHHDPLPEGQALLDYWLNDLGQSGAGRMLRALGECYPMALSKEELGARAGISAASGTFGTYLAKLRSLELVEGRGELRASKEFFE